MQGEKDVVEVVATNADVPVVKAPEQEEKPVETEDSFVEEALGVLPVADTEEETGESENDSQPEVPKVAPEAPKEEASAEPNEEEKKEETPGTQKPENNQEVNKTRVSRLDKRVAQKYVENFILKGQNVPSSDAIEEELGNMTLEEKKNALRNLLEENHQIRGRKEPTSLSNEDEEAIIEAEVEKRYQEEQALIRERDFQNDLVKMLMEHPELDSRNKAYNPKIENAVFKIVQSGVFVSEAYNIVSEAVKNAKEEGRKQEEIEKQKAMAGAVITPPVSEPINTNKYETDEDKFIADALG